MPASQLPKIPQPTPTIAPTAPPTAVPTGPPIQVPIVAPILAPAIAPTLAPTAKPTPSAAAMPALFASCFVPLPAPPFLYVSIMSGVSQAKPIAAVARPPPFAPLAIPLTTFDELVAPFS